MYTTVVFDIGNVLFHYQPLVSLRKKYGEEVAQELLRAVFHSEEWVRLDEGTLTLSEARELLSSRHPSYREAIKEALEDWLEDFLPYPAMMTLLEDLHKRDIHLYYLSNMGQFTAEHILRNYSCWELFEGGIFSYAQRLLKPDRAIYTRLLEQFALPADSCVFVDDSAANVQGAKDVGMGGIVHTSPEETRCQLEALLNVRLSQ